MTQCSLNLKDPPCTLVRARLLYRMSVCSIRSETTASERCADETFVAKQHLVWRRNVCWRW